MVCACVHVSACLKLTPVWCLVSIPDRTAYFIGTALVYTVSYKYTLSIANQVATNRYNYTKLLYCVLSNNVVFTVYIIKS